MNKLVTFGAFIALAGCGVSEEKFKDQYVAAYCDAIVNECADDATLLLFNSTEDCETFIGAFTDAAASVEGCEYDAKQAKACLSAADNADCETWNAGGPSECDTVYGEACSSGSTGSSTTPTLSE